MSKDPIRNPDVMADLTSRRKTLNSRMSNIDVALGGIRSLLEEGGVKKTDAEAEPDSEKVQAAVPEATLQSEAIRKAALNRAAPMQGKVDRRRKANKLNVYKNPFPELRRAMVKEEAQPPSKPGVRCPKCGSCDTRQSFTRTFGDVFLFFIDFVNARCRNCNSRFRVWRTAAADLPEEFTDPVA